MKTFNWIQYKESMKLPDGIYNCLYNKEPSILQVKDNKPSRIQFINTKIFDGKGILFSSVEILLPSQKI